MTQNSEPKGCIGYKTILENIRDEAIHKGASKKDVDEIERALGMLNSNNNLPQPCNKVIEDIIRKYRPEFFQ